MATPSASALGNLIDKVVVLESANTSTSLQKLITSSSVNDFNDALDITKKLGSNADIYQIFISGLIANPSIILNFNGIEKTLDGIDTSYKFSSTLAFDYMSKNQIVEVTGTLGTGEVLEGYTNPTNYYLRDIEFLPVAFNLSLTADGPPIQNSNVLADTQLIFTLKPSKYIEDNGIRIIYDHDDSINPYPLTVTVETQVLNSDKDFVIQKGESVTIIGSPSQREVVMGILPRFELPTESIPAGGGGSVPN